MGNACGGADEDRRDIKGAGEKEEEMNIKDYQKGRNEHGCSEVFEGKE